jgi:hypothetical protein
MYFLSQGESQGHVQSLIIGSALWFVGGQMFITGLLAVAIGWNRRMMEDVIYRMKEDRIEAASGARRPVRKVSPRALTAVDDNQAPEDGRIEDAA